MRVTFTFRLFISLAVLNPSYSCKASPILCKRVLGVPVQSGDSYITAITAIGSLIVLLFAAKWFYVSRRQRKERMRSRKYASMWRDDFSSSSLHVWRKGSSNKDHPVKSAFLVGLFGSPSWETRYSAIVDNKVPGGQLQSLRQDLVGPVGSIRSKSASEKSDKPSPISSPIFESKSRVNSIVMRSLDGTRPKSLSESMAVLVPSPVLGSMDYLSWKKNLLSGKHASYPTGLCIESGTGSLPFKSKTPAAFLPSVSPTGPPSVASFESRIGAQERPQGVNDVGLIMIKDNTSLGRLGTSELCWKSTYAAKEPPPPRLSIEYALIDDSPQPQNQESTPLHAHPYSQMSGHPVTSEIDLGQSKLGYLSLDLEASNLDFCHPCRVSPATPPSVKLQSRISPPRDHGRSRIRRSSPKLGPSPLRRMFLPSDDLTNEEHDVTLDMQPQVSSAINSIHSSYSQFSYAIDSEHFGKTRPSIGKLTMSDNLLDFLDELVQETSDWDASLFIDDRFKAMMDHSKSSDTPSTCINQIKRSTLSRKPRAPSFTLLEGIPEVDVTDFSPSDSEVVLNHSYWSDEDECQRDTMGIAH